MREFFKGWRRKAGCVALVTALVLTVLWLRSFAVFDVVDISRGEQRCLVVSARGMIFSTVWHETNPSFRRRHVWQRVDMSRLDDPTNDIQLALESFQRFDWHIPYWSIILPLTLLSAYLLLWTPRTKERRDA